MPAVGEKAVGRRSGVLACWREVLFWMLLLPAFSALTSTAPRRQAAGILEVSGFLLVAVSFSADSETWGSNLSPGNESAGEPLSVASSGEFRRLPGRPRVQVLPPADLA